MCLLPSTKLMFNIVHYFINSCLLVGCAYLECAFNIFFCIIFTELRLSPDEKEALSRWEFTATEVFLYQRKQLEAEKLDEIVKDIQERCVSNHLHKRFLKDSSYVCHTYCLKILTQVIFIVWVGVAKTLKIQWRALYQNEIL